MAIVERREYFEGRLCKSGRMRHEWHANTLYPRAACTLFCQVDWERHTRALECLLDNLGQEGNGSQNQEGIFRGQA